MENRAPGVRSLRALVIGVGIGLIITCGLTLLPKGVDLEALEDTLFWASQPVPDDDGSRTTAGR